jgi:hypothetical protein
MSREKKPGEIRHDAMKDRMMKTERGQAIYKILEMAGGRVSLSRILDIRLTVISGWCSRCEITVAGAKAIGESQFFKDRGVTRDFARPGMTDGQWIAADNSGLAISEPRSKDQVSERLNKTPEGSALNGILKDSGGPTALARVIGVDPEAVYNWISRGKISRDGAVLVGNNENFDVTAEQMRPDLTKFQWMDKR